MSDFNSSLPVRTQTNGDVAAKIVDGTLTSQALAVDAAGKITTKLDDAAGNGITSQVNGSQQALDVGIDVAGVQIDPRQIRALTSADVVTVDQGTNPWTTKDAADGSVSGGTAGTFSMLSGAIFNSTPPSLSNGQQASLQSDSSGNLKVDLATALPSGTNTIGKVEITDGTNTVGVTPASTAATATQPAEVVALSPNSPLPTGTNAIGSVLANIQVASAPVSGTNPVPVAIVSSPVGTPVVNYNTAAAVASGSTSNHTYTITASKTFYGKYIHASASGKLKIEVQISPDGSTYSSIFVGFNSTATPNIDISLDELVFLESGTGATVRIIRTNEDNQAQDVYSTICGTEQ